MWRKVIDFYSRIRSDDLRDHPGFTAMGGGGFGVSRLL